eukprot:scaffold15093_cov114-Isochrysis_galbana.AAC.3
MRRASGVVQRWTGESQSEPAEPAGGPVRRPHLALRDSLEHLGVQIPEDALAVGDEELAAPLSRRLEADKRAHLGRLLEGGLVVQADGVRLPEGGGNGWDCASSANSAWGQPRGGSTGTTHLGEELAEARGMQRVKARVHLERLPEAAEAVRVLHQVKAAEPDATVLLEGRLELVLVLEEPRRASRVGRVGRVDLNWADGQDLPLVYALPLVEVEAVGVPHSCRAVREPVAQRRRLIWAHELGDGTHAPRSARNADPRSGRRAEPQCRSHRRGQQGSEEHGPHRRGPETPLMRSRSYNNSAENSVRPTLASATPRSGRPTGWR